MREVIATGKTVEEATENACAELGKARDEVSVEILEMPVKKLFKTIPAKVKVCFDDGAEPAVPTVPPLAETAPPKAPPKKAAPVAVSAQKAPAPAAPAETQAVLPAEPEVELVIDDHPRVRMAADYLGSIFAAMGIDELALAAFRQGDATLFRIEGEQVAGKIEIRGEVIQALSYLVDRAVNSGVDKKESDYLRVRLDVAGYRNRREGELIALANRTGKEVARTARSRTLAPMNPYERLIVHTTISKIEGITSESVGADTERRVVIKSLAANATDGGDWRPPRKGGPRPGRDSRSGGRERDRGDRGGRDRGANRGGRTGGERGDRRGERGGYGRPSNTPEREYAGKTRDPNAAPVVPERREAVHDGEDLPLYGKIEL